jgi:hypothetical protein
MWVAVYNDFKRSEGGKYGIQLCMSAVTMGPRALFLRGGKTLCLRKVIVYYHFIALLK